MANQNSNSFLAKFAKLPLATKIISLVCVVVIVAGSATAAVLLSSPETSGNISSGGTAKSSTQKVHSTTRFSDRYTPTGERSYDFVPDTMASSAHEDAVRMHNEAMDIVQRQQNFAHEEAVRMNDTAMNSFDMGCGGFGMF